MAFDNDDVLDDSDDEDLKSDPVSQMDMQVGPVDLSLLKMELMAASSLISFLSSENVQRATRATSLLLWTR